MAECELVAFLRAAGPARVPLRTCCVVGLIDRSGSARPEPRVCAETVRAETVCADARGDEEPGPAPLEVQQKALIQYRGLLELGELPAFADPLLTDPQLSFQIAQSVQDLDFLNLLLRNRSESERLKQLAEYLSTYVPKMRQTKLMKKLAPLNGHGKLPSGIS